METSEQLERFGQILLTNSFMVLKHISTSVYNNVLTIPQTLALENM